MNDPPFQGAGVAIVRPSHFSAAARGEESDMLFGVEEAGVAAGRWLLRGLVSGATSLRVELPLDAAGHEGPQAAATRAWVNELQTHLGERVRIGFRDERLTSHVAETRLGPMPRGRSGGPPLPPSPNGSTGGGSTGGGGGTV